MPSKSRAASAANTPSKARAYVLDTNVLLHDPAALFHFEEHDIHLPLVVLEELDRHKKGVADLARNARQVTRSLDQLLQHGSMKDGFDLAAASGGKATGRLFFRGVHDKTGSPLNQNFEADKADNVILASATALIKDSVDAVLVTKDINLRVKALASDIPAQDYRSDRSFSDADVLPTGFIEADAELWEQQPEGEEGIFRRGNRQHIRLNRRLAKNSFVIERTARGRVRLWRVVENTSTTSVLAQVVKPDTGKETLLTARNDEQALALDLLNDNEVDAVALLGKAGSGKTLLALAAGLEQVKAGRFESVLITRATVPMGEDIGFLPGTEEDKMNAWLGGTIQDCYTALKLTDEKNPLRMKVEVNSMSFMRGRSFHGKYVIIDEAQNLTAKQTRALLTRAGEGTKVVITGNLAQIDTPYLDEGSSGLAWAVKNLSNWDHAGHIILPRGVRSRLATYIEEVAEAGEGADNG